MSLRSAGGIRGPKVLVGSILSGGRGFLKMEFCISGEEFPTWTASFAHLCLPLPFPKYNGSLNSVGGRASPQLLCSPTMESEGLRTRTPSFREHLMKGQVRVTDLQAGGRGVWKALFITRVTPFGPSQKDWHGPNSPVGRESCL